jgi:hypothetical protein
VGGFIIAGAGASGPALDSLSTLRPPHVCDAAAPALRPPPPPVRPPPDEDLRADGQAWIGARYIYMQIGRRLGTDRRTVALQRRSALTQGGCVPGWRASADGSRSSCRRRRFSISSGLGASPSLVQPCSLSSHFSAPSSPRLPAPARPEVLLEGGGERRSEHELASSCGRRAEFTPRRRRCYDGCRGQRTGTTSLIGTCAAMK